MSVLALNLAWRRLGLALVLTAGLPALGQQAAETSLPTSSETAGADDSRLSHSLPDLGGGGSSLFGGRAAAFDILPVGPQPIILNNNPAQWQRFLDQRKNWALLTPKEILNIPTAESILNLPDSQAEAGLTAEQRFLHREDQDLQTAATNGARRLLEADPMNPLKAEVSGDQDDGRSLDQFLSPARAGEIDSPKGLKPLDAHDLPGLGRRDALGSTWSSPFGVPLQETKQTPEQLAGMERFRALMEPSSALVKPGSSTLEASFGSGLNADAPSASAATPIGRAYTALEDTSSKPTTLKPLPALGAQPPAPKKVSWVQPPPWMSQSPQSPTLPQRQF